MKLYHGTDERSAREIEESGWMGSVVTDDNLDLTSGEISEDGVVFLAENPELAEGYGEVVFEIDTEDAVFFRNCPVTGQKEYYVQATLLNEEGWWERI